MCSSYEIFFLSKKSFQRESNKIKGEAFMASKVLLWGQFTTRPFFFFSINKLLKFVMWPNIVLWWWVH